MPTAKVMEAGTIKVTGGSVYTPGGPCSKCAALRAVLEDLDELFRRKYADSAGVNACLGDDERVLWDKARAALSALNSAGAADGK